MFTFVKPQEFLCEFKIAVGDEVRVHTIEAPRIVLEQEFLGLVEQAANHPYPVKVRMSRKVPVYDPFDKTTVERENEIVFKNKAWNDRNK